MNEQIDVASVPNKLRAKFFRDEGRDYIEISIIGDPNTVIRKVTPEDVHRFPRDWEAHQTGNEDIIGGIPLTEVPGVDKNAALGLRLKGVRNAEELAGLDEAAAKGLGMGGLPFWNAAKNLVKLRQLEAMQSAIAEAPKRSRASRIEPEHTEGA